MGDLAELLAAATAEARSPLELSVLRSAIDQISEALRLEQDGDHEGAQERRELAEVHLEHIVGHTVDRPCSAAFRLTAEDQQRISQLEAGGTAPQVAFAQVMKSIGPKERDARSRAAWHSIRRGKALFHAKTARENGVLLRFRTRTVRPVARPRAFRRTRRSAPTRGSPSRKPDPDLDPFSPARLRGLAVVLGGQW